MTDWGAQEKISSIKRNCYLQINEEEMMCLSDFIVLEYFLNKS